MTLIQTYASASIQASNWQKISELIDCFCVVYSFEKDFLENSRILSCFVQLKSVLFDLLCVFDKIAIFIANNLINPQTGA